jgi:predicted transglutaminase-like cysteine proteinase
MLVFSRLRTVACRLAVLGLVGLCGNATFARSVAELQLAALGPVTTAPIYVPPAASQEPFGLTLATDGALSARWRSLQPVIRVEVQLLTLCRTNPKLCPSAAAKFLAIIDAARARTGLARVGEINRAINLAIRPASDLAQYGAPDVWATPLMTFTRGAGDCEDYAIAKYVALIEAGVPAEDVRLVIMHDQLVHEDHAVAAARVEGQWLILDNRRMMLLADRYVRNVTPLLELGNVNANLPVATAPQPANQASGISAGAASINMDCTLRQPFSLEQMADQENKLHIVL